MKALLCHTYGLPATLEVAEVPQPLLQAHEVLIKVSFCGVNFPDTLLIQNKYQYKPALPFSPGGEVAGTVVAVGNQVTSVQPGTRVVALCGWGGFAHYVAVNASRVFALPPAVDFENAAASFYNFATAYHALKDRAQLKPGETLLVLGAAGGVGLATVVLGKLMGATVIAAASTHDKLALCKKKGADFLINYATHALKESVKEITKGGVDVVFDPVGGLCAEAALRTLNWRGRHLVVGFTSGSVPAFAANIPLLKGAAIVGVFYSGFAQNEPTRNAENMQELMQWSAAGKINQAVYKTYSLEQAAQALQDLIDRKILGKAIVKLD